MVMKEGYLIEKVSSPGSFWSETFNRFEDLVYATKYSVRENNQELEEAMEKAVQFATIKKVKIYYI
jgi:hypothetical protein